MKDSFLLGKITKNNFANIPDIVFNKFVLFSKKNPDTVPLLQVFQKMMILDFIIPLLKNSFKGGQILEMGCGSGIHSSLLSNFGKVSATDLKKTTHFLGDSVDTDRKRIFDALAANPIDFRYNNGASIPFENESFDMVFHNSVIEHVPDVNAFNQEVRRVLKPGGFCVCITGTPALCRYRFIKYHLLRFPLIVMYGFLKASTKTFFSRLSLIKKLYAFISARVWHFYPTDERLQDILDKNYDGNDEASSLSEDAIKSMYSSLLHFIREPDYNRILMEQLSARNKVSPRSLLLQLVCHFKSPWNEFMFSITPQTHGQHTQNYKTEMQEWRVENWIKSFTDECFRVQAVRGCRYLHIFDITYNYNINSWVTYMALPLVRTISRTLPPWFSSEFIILAEKTRTG